MANGTFPPDFTTDVGKVRALIPDLSTADGTVDTDYLFGDSELEAYLAIYNGSLRRAAAAAIDAIAVNEVLTYRYLRTDDLQVDGTKGAEVLRKRAQTLRDEADVIDATDAVDAFEIAYPESGFIPEGVPSAWGRAWTWEKWR